MRCVVAAGVAANIAGAFPLAPFGNTPGISSVEEFASPGFVPNSALWCVSASGSVPISAEASPQ